MQYKDLSSKEQDKFNTLSEIDKEIVLFDSFMMKTNKTFSEVRFDGWSFAEKINYFKNKN